MLHEADTWTEPFRPLQHGTFESGSDSNSHFQDILREMLSMMLNVWKHSSKKSPYVPMIGITFFFAVTLNPNP